jgi:hypothetical protein
MMQAPERKRVWCALTATATECWEGCSYYETGRCKRYIPLAAPGVMLGDSPNAHVQRIVQIIPASNDASFRLVALTDHGRLYGLAQDGTHWKPLNLPELPHV